MLLNLLLLTQLMVAGPITAVGFSNGSFIATGGAAPFLFDIIDTYGADPSGSGKQVLIHSQFPPGLTLNESSGVVSGTPTQSGSYTFCIQVRGDYHQSADNCGSSIPQCFTWTVGAGNKPAPPTVFSVVIN